MATAAAPAAAAPVATQPVAVPFGTTWNKWVDGVFNRLVTKLDYSAHFSLNLEKKGDVEADTTAKKTAKMFALVLPLLVFTVLAAVGSAISSIKACVVKEKAAELSSIERETSGDGSQ